MAPAVWRSEVAVVSAVGNDVVDLCDSDSDATTHPRRFDERVFSPAERTMIRESAESAESGGSGGTTRLRWRLWAAKEAAFKAARKLDAATVFSPRRFEVEFSGAHAGRVTHRRKGGAVECFELAWWHDDDAVHAVAKHEGTSPPEASAQLIHSFRRLEPKEAAECESGSTGCGPSWGPSRAVRIFAREQLSRALDVPVKALDIRSHGRVPTLWRDSRLARADLSLSHHGEWIAFACWLDASELSEGPAGRSGRSAGRSLAAGRSPLP